MKRSPLYLATVDISTGWTDHGTTYYIAVYRRRPSKRQLVALEARIRRCIPCQGWVERADLRISTEVEKLQPGEEYYFID